jgi:hypothetical protein
MREALQEKRRLEREATLAAAEASKSAGVGSGVKAVVQAALASVKDAELEEERRRAQARLATAARLKDEAGVGQQK